MLLHLVNIYIHFPHLSLAICLIAYKYLHEMWWADKWAQSFVVTNVLSRSLDFFIYSHVINYQASQYQVGQWFQLQRWMDACGGGRGHYPIKFNGLIFVTGIFLPSLPIARSYYLTYRG